MRSALIVSIPEADEAVARHRAHLDDAAAWGIPAHVTVVFPFMPPAEVDSEVIGSLGAAISSVRRFHARFETTGWFGSTVLWLAPRPAAAFGALTSAVADAFPDYLPYGGVHEEVIPHLTVGHDVPERDLREAEAGVLAGLPIRADVAEVGLWCGTDVPGGWHRTTGFPLG
jgi:2'-5' RNA ligase